MPLRLCIFAVLLASALAADRTLGTVSGPCKDQFEAIAKEHYGDDDKCQDLIEKAMSTAPQSPTDCPGQAVADVGTDVQKCMSKTPAAKAAWTSFIKQCEVLNVNERTGAGEAEAAADAKPSCFPRFNSLAAFTSYLEGGGATATPSAAGTAQVAQGTALLAAAAAGFALLL